MLFNSYSFLFLFLPTVLGLFFFLKVEWRAGFLVLASLIFYAQSGWENTSLLLATIAMNRFAALRLEKQPSSWLFGVAVGLNLLPLLYFKYAESLLGGTHSLVIPLAISFYTFQQIAFLADVQKKKCGAGTLQEYLFFVLFFPQLVAGPIVHHQALIPQVRQGVLKQADSGKIKAGIVLFCMGLFKKVVLADMLMTLATQHFAQLATLSSADAWSGLLAYSLAIYFDFSAYSDMAIGLALLFGLKLPVNFYSPYKAVDVVDFWRRWHMTLSHFLRDYIYIPLGGSKKGRGREMFSLLVTMLVGGVWHGAGWNFLLWGLGHGILLTAVHLKRRYAGQWKLPTGLAVALTFFSVTLLWVLFYTQGLEEATKYYRVLFSMQGSLAWNSEMLSIAAGLGIVWFLPNTMQAVHYTEQLRVTRRHAVWAALLGFVALKMMAEMPAVRFIYFNF